MKTKLISAVIISLSLLVLPTWVAAGGANDKPKLVLQITVDQMRGDFPMRYKDRLGEGGFRYLMDKGTHYINAHFQHADTETPIGHAALYTGTYPAHNGIVAGNWFDADKGRVIYNNNLDGLSVAVVHGSPWRYDTYVPIFFAGNGIKPQTVSRRVHTVDVAITLATAIGTKPPSGAAGEVLLEVLGQ